MHYLSNLELNNCGDCIVLINISNDSKTMVFVYMEKNCSHGSEMVSLKASTTMETNINVEESLLKVDSWRDK